MSKKLFVGGLSWDTTDQSLRTAFEAFGAVREARVILDRDTGRSRGFGFVTYDDASAGDEAITKMNGAMLDGRTIRVNEAEERRGGGNRRRNFDRGGPEVHTRGRGGPPRGRGPGGPRGGGGGGGFSAPPPGIEPPGAPGEGAGWEEDRAGRRDFNKKKKKKPTRDDDFRPRAPAAKRRRRESGRTWRDYQMEEDIPEDTDDFDFG